MFFILNLGIFFCCLTFFQWWLFSCMTFELFQWIQWRDRFYYYYFVIVILTVIHRMITIDSIRFDWLIDFLNWIIHKETFFFLNCHRMCNLMCFYVCSVCSVCVFVAKFNWSAIVSFVKKKSILFFLIFIFSLWFCSNHHHHCFVLFCFVW